MDYDLTVYGMVKKGDILGYTFPDGHSEAQNAGSTTHRGVEAGLGVQLAPALRADVAYAYAKHLYADWKTNASVDLSGKELVAAPRSVGSATLVLQPGGWNGAELAIHESLCNLLLRGKPACLRTHGTPYGIHVDP